MKLVSKVAFSALISAAVFPVALMSPLGMQQVQAGEAPVDAAELEEPVTSVESLSPTAEEPSVAPETTVEAESEETADVAEVDSVESDAATEAAETEVITEETPATDSEEAIGGAELETETDVVESEATEGTY